MIFNNTINKEIQKVVISSLNLSVTLLAFAQKGEEGIALGLETVLESVLTYLKLKAAISIFVTLPFHPKFS